MHGSEGGESGSTGLPYPYPDLSSVSLLHICEELLPVF